MRNETCARVGHIKPKHLKTIAFHCSLCGEFVVPGIDLISQAGESFDVVGPQTTAAAALEAIDSKPAQHMEEQAAAQAKLIDAAMWHFKGCTCRACVDPYGAIKEAIDGVTPKLPTDAKARKNAPMARGLLDYFPQALMAVAELSRVANEQHNPGEPMHWAREKSTDHADCIMRHLVDRGSIDSDGQRHMAKVAWRALAELQLEIERASLDEHQRQQKDQLS